jgi:hypothetical protein
MEYTKGVWKNVHGDITVYGRGVIARIPTPQDDGVFECAINRRLIMASPDMYEALKLLADDLKHDNGTCILEDTQLIIQKALAKAEGK